MQAATSLRGTSAGLPLYVVSEHRLVAEAIAAALVGAGIDARVIADPTQDRFARLAAGARALIVCDLGDVGSLRWADATITALACETLVLTSAPEGPAWGAALEAGASSVMSSETPLREVAAHLRGQRDRISVGDRTVLVNQWRRVEASQQEALRLLATLTPRELQVLRMLHAGRPVGGIAEQFGTSVSTVRSQVRSIREKLNVGSQLAAVAVYRATLRGAHVGEPGHTRLALVDGGVPNSRENLDPSAKDHSLA